MVSPTFSQCMAQSQHSVISLSSSRRAELGERQGGRRADRSSIVNCRGQLPESQVSPGLQSSWGMEGAEQEVQVHLVPPSQVWDTFSCCKMKQWSQSSNVLAFPSQVQRPPVHYESSTSCPPQSPQSNERGRLFLVY